MANRIARGAEWLGELLVPVAKGTGKVASGGVRKVKDAGVFIGTKAAENPDKVVAAGLLAANATAVQQGLKFLGGLGDNINEGAEALAAGTKSEFDKLRADLKEKANDAEDLASQLSKDAHHQYNKDVAAVVALKEEGKGFIQDNSNLIILSVVIGLGVVAFVIYETR